jgi:hypothetical protein
MAGATRHTPGPWTWKWGTGDEPVVAGRAGRSTVAICLMQKPREMEANARLIAAAPDLLAWCKALAALIECDQEAHADDLCVRCNADAAIAKAHGSDGARRGSTRERAPGPVGADGGSRKSQCAKGAGEESRNG